MLKQLQAFFLKLFHAIFPPRDEPHTARQHQSSVTDSGLQSDENASLFPAPINHPHPDASAGEHPFPVEVSSAFNAHRSQLALEPAGTPLGLESLIDQHPASVSETVDEQLFPDIASVSAEASVHPVFIPEPDSLPLLKASAPAYAIPEPQAGRLEALRSTANAAMSREDWGQASADWAALREIAPTEPTAFVQGAEALWRLGRIENADALLAEAVKTFPDNDWVAHAYAGLAGRRGDWNGARDRWQAVRERFPDDMAGYANGAATLIHLGALDDADDLVRWTLDHHPDRPDGWIHDATLASRRAAWSEAVQKWAVVRSRFPDLAVGYGATVDPLVQLGQYDEAKTIVALGVAKHPDNLWLAYVQAELPGHQSDWLSAAELWVDVCRRFPADLTSHQNAAFAYAMAGEFDAADATLVDTCARFPNRPEPMCWRAELTMRQQHWAEAIPLWAEIRAKFPNETQPYDGGITALRELGRDEEADELAHAKSDRPGKGTGEKPHASS